MVERNHERETITIRDTTARTATALISTTARRVTTVKIATTAKGKTTARRSKACRRQGATIPALKSSKCVAQFRNCGISTSTSKTAVPKRIQNTDGWWKR
jgi:hypothetical protein